MSDTTKLVVNVSAQVARAFFDEAAEWAAKAEAAQAAGDPLLAARYAANAESTRVAAQTVLDRAGLPADAPSTSVVALTADEVAQLSADQEAAIEAAQHAQQTLAAKNKATLLAQRNRWLFETDPYNLSGGVTDLPSAVADAVNANLAEIRAWRQAVRDWPSTVSDWTSPPPLPTPPTITLPSGSPLFRLT